MDFGVTRFRAEGGIAPPGSDGSRAGPAVDPVAAERPRAGGKFLFVGDRKLYVRGVTYGTFSRNSEDFDYPEREVAVRDLAQMTAHGINAVRTYTVPPRWLLDAAEAQGMHVMVGLPWEHHVAFLEDRGTRRSIERRVREMVASCAAHPAVLCYSIGNEIRAQIARWHGARPVERYLRRLYEAVKDEDPDALVTYVNYPSTEYLELPFLDLVAFNVYLERRSDLEAYLARLHNLAGDRPVLMAEIGLDSRRHGEEEQAAALDWQIRSSFRAGCAGAFAFGWTDEWHINPLGEGPGGGFAVEDWDFGLTTRERQPKPALAAVSAAFREIPVAADAPSPAISVVVCTRNGSRTLRGCLEGLARLTYPDYEVIVVDDGSSDDSAAIAREYDCRVIGIEPSGLSAARNVGLQAATGEIVAYIDDDAYPDADWLTYLAIAFSSGGHAAIGGPNIPPIGDNGLAACVANAPGGPIHVLLSDTVAEHVPGCNMAFRRSALLAIGGFDPQYRSAGDDVDVCWRVQQAGWTIGFAPAATVWHHRRPSIRAYWRQQRGYGEAEALVERKWPEKYNGVGHPSWGGRLYGQGLIRLLGRRRGRIYQGTWGTGLFQSIYDRPASLLSQLPAMPEWHLVVLGLTFATALGALWPPLLAATPLLAAAIGVVVAQAGLSAARASFPGCRSRRTRYRLRALTAVLYMLQPLARLAGRIRHGLTPWRRRGTHPFAVPVRRSAELWSESWRAPEDRLGDIESAVRGAGGVVMRGGDFDRWDLEVRAGGLGSARLLMAVEEYPHGRQLVRTRWWPRVSGIAVGALVSAILLAAAAVAGGAPDAIVAVAAGLSVAVLGRMLLEAAAATGCFAGVCAPAADETAAEVQPALVGAPQAEPE